MRNPQFYVSGKRPIGELIMSIQILNEISMISADQTDSSREQLAMWNCCNIYQTSSSPNLNKVRFINVVSENSLYVHVNVQSYLNKIIIYGLHYIHDTFNWITLIFISAVKETCDWFVANYEQARKWASCFKDVAPIELSHLEKTWHNYIALRDKQYHVWLSPTCIQQHTLGRLVDAPEAELSGYISLHWMRPLYYGCSLVYGDLCEYFSWYIYIFIYKYL